MLWTWNSTALKRQQARHPPQREHSGGAHPAPAQDPPRGQLETPHVMMLADDEACTLIEPIAAHKAELPLLYDGALMLNGGHLAGWAVEDPALVEQINTALANLGDAAAFAARWPAAAGQPP